MLGRATRFAGGFAVGLLGLPILALVAFLAWAAILIGIEAAGLTPQTREISAAFWTRGWDVTRAGGATVLVKQDDEAVTRQTCREACDDLVYWFGRAERVEVRNSGGECVVCKGQGLRLPFQSPKRWALEGAPLQLREDNRR